MKSTTPLSARWTCPTNKPDLSVAVRKRRTGTAKFFTLLLLPYLTTAKAEGIKASYNDGVLSLTLPKKDVEVSGSRRLAIE